MQRISASGGAHRAPVLVQHGITMDGMSWMLNSPEESLPFILVGKGFDVWLGNTRGTKWSRRHATLNSSSKEYWNWSWDELVEYDFSATVGFVYGKTGHKLHYIGHSLGTLVALASLSEGKMVEKLRCATLLSPIAYLNHMTGLIGVLSAFSFMGEASFFIQCKIKLNQLHLYFIVSHIPSYHVLCDQSGYSIVGTGRIQCKAVRKTC
ncbi:Triacylglycerol lipase [Zostera marina]|uniref:Triacylglycerol lipase n=1 Tax=Zostera marina TaxID=29655 RepID=A0A0K9NS60_ZOSMR|nr:Triacylglycerol lipase [Zostera marina]